MIVPKELIRTGKTSVPLEYRMGVEAPNNCRLGRVGASLTSLPTNAEEIRDEIPIDDKCCVSGEASSRRVHIETYILFEGSAVLEFINLMTDLLGLHQ